MFRKVFVSLVSLENLFKIPIDDSLTKIYIILKYCSSSNVDSENFIFCRAFIYQSQ